MLRNETRDDGPTRDQLLVRFRQLSGSAVAVGEFRVGHREIALPAGIVGVGPGQAVSCTNANLSGVGKVRFASRLSSLGRIIVQLMLHSDGCRSVVTSRFL